MEKILNGVNRIVEYIVSLLLIVMVIVVFLQVIFRFVLHSSLPWSEEVSRYIHMDLFSWRQYRREKRGSYWSGSGNKHIAP